jgi:molybdate transport system permease protein
MVLSPAEITTLFLSVQIGFVAASLALPVAVGVAYVLARCTFPGRFLLDTLIHLPLVLPPVVVGYLLLIAFGRNGMIGEALYNCCGISFSFRWTGAALASGIMAFPLMVRAIRLSIEAVDRRLEQSAATMGAAPFFVFVTVTLPLAAPGLLAAYVLGFAKALGEFGATITFVSNIPGETQTLPLAIYSAMQTPDGNESVLRLVMLSIAISVIALLGSEWLSASMRKRSAL